MRIAMRSMALCLFVCIVTIPDFGQSVGVLSGKYPNAQPGYAQRQAVHVNNVPEGFSRSGLVFDAVTGKLIGGGSGSAKITANVHASAAPAEDSDYHVEDPRPNLPTIDGLNTLATFDGSFVAQAGPSASGDFRFTMIGNDPRLGGTTEYSAAIDEVSLQLLNADGSVFTTVPFSPFENMTLESPNFEPLDYRSGHQVEYADAIHRAEFYNTMKANWHTLLIPHVVNRVTIQVPFFVNLQLSNGDIIQARSYFTGTAGDGSTFVLMLSPLFNFFFDNEVVNEINLGNFTTDAVNMTLFPNTYLFNLNVNNPNTPGGCCVLGFHTYFLDGAFPESRWVTEYASWISPGLFGAGFQDVTALSHETSEAFADPFVDNPTPNWQFPGEPANAKVCQNNLEDGDPVEVLPNATSPVEVKEQNFDFIYHPQNLALRQWFEMGTTSGAIDGAFSFPDETVLPHSALPCPQ
ncbi:MAG TPA: hypothetical protein VG267_02930 [Terracidiphilus sp.]|jgi:hypothetical protein|nr:hypothetical protein [Terracidiphilus sp.]